MSSGRAGGTLNPQSFLHPCFFSSFLSVSEVLGIKPRALCMQSKHPAAFPATGLFFLTQTARLNQFLTTWEAEAGGTL